MCCFQFINLMSIYSIYCAIYQVKKLRTTIVLNFKSFEIQTLTGNTAMLSNPFLEKCLSL